MRIADTSFLYALFSDSDSFHTEALKIARRRKPITVPSEIYSETIALIHYRQGFNVAKSAGDWLRAHPRIEIRSGSDRVLEEAWRAYSGARGSLSYPDSVVVAWSQGRGAVPLAFDTRVLAHSRR